MRVITFSVDGIKPVGKQRPRFTYGGRTYTPDKTKSFEAMVAKAYREAGGKLVENAEWFEVEVISYFTPPKSAPKKFWKRVAEEVVRYTKKPDADNLLKICMDGLNGVAFSDDALVTDSISRKRYATSPRMVVNIKWMEVMT